MGIHYYLIHGIDISRKEFMENQFKKFGIPDNDTTWITYPNKYDPLPDVCTNISLPRGMVSCTYKHYLALKDICEKGYEYAVIMEDNIEFIDNVPFTLQRYLKELPDDWDLLIDSNFTDRKPLNATFDPEKKIYRHIYDYTWLIEYLDVNVTRYEQWGATKGAHFVFLTQKAANMLYKKFIPFKDSSDHHYDTLLNEMRLNVYWAEPPNVKKIERPSTWKDDDITRNIKVNDIILKSKKVKWLNI